MTKCLNWIFLHLLHIQKLDSNRNPFLDLYKQCIDQADHLNDLIYKPKIKYLDRFSGIKRSKYPNPYMSSCHMSSKCEPLPVNPTKLDEVVSEIIQLIEKNRDKLKITSNQADKAQEILDNLVSTTFIDKVQNAEFDGYLDKLDQMENKEKPESTPSIKVSSPDNKD